MREDRLASLEVSAISIGVMADVLERAGIDPGPAFVQAGLDPARPLPASGIVSARCEAAFQRSFNALTPGRRDLWADVGRRLRLPTYGLYGLTLMTSPTLRHWVNAAGLAQHLCISFADYRPVARSGELCGIEFSLEAVPADIREMTLFRDLGALSAVLDDLWRGSRKAFRIEVAATPADGEIIRRTFPFKVRFECPKTILSWPAALSDAELPYGSRRAHACYLDQCLALLRKIPGNEIEGRITHIIMLNPRAHNNIAAVAQRLNVSVRTLQRRLGEERLTFRAILDQTQAELAKEKLRETSLSIAQISDQLGYADRASFDVAFGRWASCSPRRYREEARESRTVIAM